MNQDTSVIVYATMLSAVAVTLTTWLVDIPPQWQALFLAGTPVGVCLLAALATNAWQGKRDRKDRSEEPNHLEKFVASIKYVDREWHKPFEMAGRFYDQSVSLFVDVSSDIAELYNPNDRPRIWRYKIASEMVGDSLRIMDSVLSQLRLGHPDTALSTVRQLFELSMYIRVIAIDRTGETAKHYRDHDEADYLNRSIRRGSSRDQEQRGRLSTIEDEYGTSRFPGQYSWIRLPNGKSPRGMEDIIQYVVVNYYDYAPERKFRVDQYMKQWEVLNKWAHISKAASGRKLGTRSGDGYLPHHLVEKSNIGLNVPLSLAMGLLETILQTYADIAYDLTGKDHDTDLIHIEATMGQVASLIGDVRPELLAGDFRLTARAFQYFGDNETTHHQHGLQV